MASGWRKAPSLGGGRTLAGRLRSGLRGGRELGMGVTEWLLLAFLAVLVLGWLLWRQAVRVDFGGS